MALLRCPICGEKFSDTYRQCPFCQEDAALSRGERIRRSGKRNSRHQQPNILSPILIFLILIMLALLIYLLYGEQIQESLAETFPDYFSETQISGAYQDSNQDEQGEQDNQSEQMQRLSELEAINPAGLPETLTPLFQGAAAQTLVLVTGDAPIQLTASGSDETLIWLSSDETVVSVDESLGILTAVSAGKAAITVHDGKHKGICMITVNQRTTGTPGTSETETGQTNGSAETERISLSQTDFSIPLGDPGVQLQLSGISKSEIAWSSSDSDIASVSNTGFVKAVNPGTATITASFQDDTRDCLVRVRS